MRWLNFFWGKFGLKGIRPVSLARITLSGLSEWLDFQVQKIVLKKKLSEEAVRYVKTLKDKRWILECYLDCWTERIKLGQHLKVIALFEETREFLDSITFLDKNNWQDISQFNDHFQLGLEKLIAKIEASYFMHEFSFILDEKERKAMPEITLNPLLKEFVEMNGLRESFEVQIKQGGLKILEQLKKKAGLLEKYVQKIKELQEQYQTRNERLKVTLAKKKEKEQELLGLKEESFYLLVVEFEKQEKQIQEEIKNLQEEVSCFFVVMEPLLEKYRELYGVQGLIDLYLEDGSRAFAEDGTLVIENLLQDSKLALLDGKVELDGNLAKINLNLRKASKGYLRVLKEKEVALKTKLVQLELPAGCADFLGKFRELNYRLDHFNEQKDNLERELSFLMKEFEKNKELLQEEKKLIEEKIKQVLNQEVAIIVR